jgi:hypothetical protein
MIRLPRPRLPRRKGTPPPGIWLGRPHLGAKWRFDGRTYVLTTVSTDRDLDGGIVRLEYQDQASHLARFL